MMVKGDPGPEAGREPGGLSPRGQPGAERPPEGLPQEYCTENPWEGGNDES